VYEWLSLISLGSPRVYLNDQIDPFLSRYVPPPPKLNDCEKLELVKITWEGFMSSRWAHEVFVQTVLAATAKMWFGIILSGFNESFSGPSRDCIVLKLPEAGNEYVLWEVEEG
jgi:ribonuclease P/MRP protein subunit RPP40